MLMRNVIEIQNLASAIKKRKAILFVGAGASLSLGLPSWHELIRHMAEELGLSDADNITDYLSLAEYYKLKRGTLGALRSWMDVTWHGSNVDVSKSELHHLIVELDFPIIYTTNYDRWIEKTFDHYGKPYIKIANVADLTRVDDTLTQIIKFHGDFDDDASLVLTESSYFERLSFESPLDIKLRSDVLNKSILFLGYSLSDINMRYLFYKLQKLWESTSFSKIRPKSYIFLVKSANNSIQEEVFQSRGIIPITLETYTDIPLLLTNMLPDAVKRNRNKNKLGKPA